MCIYTHVYVAVMTSASCTTNQKSRSIMNPGISTNPVEYKVELNEKNEIVSGDRPFNNFSVAKLKSMVASVYHTQKPHAAKRIREKTKPFTGGEGEERGGKGRSRDS